MCLPKKSRKNKDFKKSRKNNANFKKMIDKKSTKSHFATLIRFGFYKSRLIFKTKPILSKIIKTGLILSFFKSGQRVSRRNKQTTTFFR
jgi:hypothetical protein